MPRAWRSSCATRPGPGRAALPPELVERVVALTLSEPPGEATHWTAQVMAETVGIDVSSVQRMARPRACAAPHPRPSGGRT
jgi:hypothetical protein